MSCATDSAPPRGRDNTLGVLPALALGGLHGPAELLPISSSGHLTLIPWLAGHDPERVDPELRKAFEVVLHAATAAALLIARRDELAEALGDRSLQHGQLLVLASLPPALAGFGLQRVIERHLGTPRSIAAGLITGSLAMALADRAPRTRAASEVGVADAAWLGIAQACALVPGVSRNGATLTAARARRFARADANRLSRRVALPVIGGATLLKSVRLLAHELPTVDRRALAAGAAASFTSTLACARLIDQVERDRSLLPFAAYRTLLAGLVLWRVARARRGGKSERGQFPGAWRDHPTQAVAERTASCTTMTP